MKRPKKIPFHLIAFLMLIPYVLVLHSLIRLSDSRKDSELLIAGKSLPFDGTNGWSTIHVFYGNLSGLGISPKGRKSFSQVGQDEIVMDLIGPKGYFLDLAGMYFPHCALEVLLRQNIFFSMIASY